LNSLELTAIAIEQLCDSFPDKIRLFSETELCHKSEPGKWSKKEVIGHLLDSATNNHQRFVRAQFETPTVFYDQDKWVTAQAYQHADTNTLLTLLETYNRHIAHILRHLPPHTCLNECIGKDGNKYTLQFLAQDYLDHLSHHLLQILADRSNCR
jgi:hypothetical protein